MSVDVAMRFDLIDPESSTPVDVVDGTLANSDGRRYATNDGVWDFVRADRREAVERFAADYARVRDLEHRTPLTAEAIRALPYVDVSGAESAAWQQRATSFDLLRGALAGSSSAPMAVGRLVDVGAGCGWLSARLATDGWDAAAVDISIGADGLGAARLLDEPMLLVRAEMDALPFATDSIDLVVFNAALHYAPDVFGTLGEAARVLRPGGTLAVLDSPIFKSAEAGTAMVTEFAAAAREHHGVSPAELFGPGFVAEADLERFRSAHEPAGWERIGGRTGVKGVLRGAIGARRAGREIADRPVIVATMNEKRTTQQESPS